MTSESDGIDWKTEAVKLHLNVGDQVEKVTGDYKFPGTVIAVMKKLSGVVRYAVEDDRGAIHIFNASQIALKGTSIPLTIAESRKP